MFFQVTVYGDTAILCPVRDEQVYCDQTNIDLYF